MKWPETGTMKSVIVIFRRVVSVSMLLGCFIAVQGQTAAQRRAAASLQSPVQAQIEVQMPVQQIPEPTIVIRERTFHGQISATFPMAFIDCTFVGDGRPVLTDSDGAIFLNCCFRTDGSGDLRMVETGDNIVMVDCFLIGYDGFSWAEHTRKTDRNYVSGLTLNGRELSLELNSNTIEMDGLDMVDSFRTVQHGDTIYKVPGLSNMARLWVSDNRISRKGDAVTLKAEGIADGVFIGWWSDDDLVRLVPGPGPMDCTVFLEKDMDQLREIIVNVVTESGLELSTLIQAGDEPVYVDSEGNRLSARQIRKIKRKAKRLARK